MWIDWLVIGIIAVLVTASGWYIYQQKKKGAKCIGCPYAKNCGGKCNK